MLKSDGQSKSKLSKVKFAIEVVVLHGDEDNQCDIVKQACNGLWYDYINTIKGNPVKITRLTDVDDLPDGYQPFSEPWCRAGINPMKLTIQEILEGQDPRTKRCSECGKAKDD